MGTTELFVELVVIGIGAVSWVVLATFAIFGYKWVPLDQLLSVSVLIPFLSFVYIMGIITDRIADVIFEAVWTQGIQRNYYSSSNIARDDRRLIYSKNEYLANLIEYGRSRLRISRGWAFNAVLIIVASNFFIAEQVVDRSLQGKLFVWVNVLFSFIAFFSWYTWRKLLDTQYRRLKDDAEFIRKSNKTQKRLSK